MLMGTCIILRFFRFAHVVELQSLYLIEQAVALELMLQ